MLYNRTCRICGKEFGTNVNNKITCSPECSQENQRRLHRKKYLRNNPEKGTGSRTQSLCFPASGRGLNRLRRAVATSVTWHTRI